VDPANAPSPRSGHSFTCVGERFFIFGGCGRVGGKAQAFNDLRELDTQVKSDTSEMSTFVRVYNERTVFTWPNLIRFECPR
jgi:N-acetylneuraminic acid mutarotase